MKKQATKPTERLVPDLTVQNDKTVKGGATKSERWTEALARAWGEALDRQ